MTEKHITHVEDVRRDYSDDELLEKARLVARVRKDTTRLETEKKQAADAFKNQIEVKDKEIDQLCSQIQLGYELVATPCDVVLNRPTPGMKSFVSQKTLEVIKTAPMTDSERQRSFFEDYREWEG